ncbi:MAG: 50S ribosomal protein L4 [archaeon]
MIAKLFDKSGEVKGDVDLPKCFGARVRKDILLKVFEAQKGIYSQAYGAMEGAGAQYSASGISRKKRHAWKGTYGKGISRIPRKIMSRHGASFNWIGATVSNTRGGRRPHAPKSEKNPFKKINKKELTIAFSSALSGSGKNIIIFEKSVLDLKSKEFFGLLKKIFGDAKILKVKRIRAGIGKMRGRKYKSNAGLLFIIGSDEKMARKGIDVVGVGDLRIKDLVPNGEVGRMICYSENAVKEIGLKFEGKKNGSRMNTDRHELKKKETKKKAGGKR